MDHREAFSLLGLSSNSTQEDLKKAFRDGCLKHHPDKHKEEDKASAESKFKQLNEAYQFLNKNGMRPPEGFGVPSSVNYSDFVDIPGFYKEDFRASGFHRTNFNHGAKYTEVIAPISVSVKDCANGGTVNVSYIRQVKCQNCRGTGLEKIEIIEKCPACEGKGRRDVKTTEGIKNLPCITCKGSGNKNGRKCSHCSGTTTVSNKEYMDVKIVTGTKIGTKIRIKAAGNWQIDDIYGDLVFDVTHISPYNGIYFSGNSGSDKDHRDDVSSTITISLLEALKGATKPVETVKGEKKLKIPPKTKHGDKKLIQGYGISLLGYHNFTILIDYPENVDDIVQLLEKEKSIDSSNNSNNNKTEDQDGL